MCAGRICVKQWLYLYTKNIISRYTICSSIYLLENKIAKIRIRINHGMKNIKRDKMHGESGSVTTKEGLDSGSSPPPLDTTFKTYASSRIK